MTSRGIVVGILAGVPIWMVVAAAQFVIPGVETGDWSGAIFLPVAAVAAAATAIVVVVVHRNGRVCEASAGRSPHRTVDGGVRTVYHPKAEAPLRRFVSVPTVAVGAVVVILGVVYQLPDAVVTTRIAVACAAALMLAPSIFVLVHSLRILTPVYRLTVDAEGVQLRGRRLSISIPWHDIACWRVGVPAGLLNRLIQREVVLASPADHVRDPGAADRRALWSRRDRQWLLCELALMDGGDGEIAAAFQLFACGKHAVEGAGKGSVDL